MRRRPPAPRACPLLSGAWVRGRGQGRSQGPSCGRAWVEYPQSRRTCSLLAFSSRGVCTCMHTCQSNLSPPPRPTYAGGDAGVHAVLRPGTRGISFSSPTHIDPTTTHNGHGFGQRPCSHPQNPPTHQPTHPPTGTSKHHACLPPRPLGGLHGLLGRRVPGAHLPWYVKVKRARFDAPTHPPTLPNPPIPCIHPRFARRKKTRARVCRSAKRPRHKCANPPFPPSNPNPFHPPNPPIQTRPPTHLIPTSSSSSTFLSTQAPPTYLPLYSETKDGLERSAGHGRGKNQAHDGMGQGPAVPSDRG